MKIFNSSNTKGKIVFEALVDSKTNTLLKALEDEEMTCRLRYKVLDRETIALNLVFDNPVDREIEQV